MFGNKRLSFGAFLLCKPAEGFDGFYGLELTTWTLQRRRTDVRSTMILKEFIKKDVTSEVPESDLC